MSSACSAPPINRLTSSITAVTTRLASTTFGDQLPQTGTAAENEGRIVTGAGVVDLARAEVQNPGERGHEDATLALQVGACRCELAVRLREDAVERWLECQHRVADDLLGHRHQQRDRKS